MHMFVDIVVCPICNLQFRSHLCTLDADDFLSPRCHLSLDNLPNVLDIFCLLYSVFCRWTVLCGKLFLRVCTHFPIPRGPRGVYTQMTFHPLEVKKRFPTCSSDGVMCTYVHFPRSGTPNGFMCPCVWRFCFLE